MRRRRVIIFDDDVSVTKMLNRYFNKKDYEVLIYNEPTVCPVYDKQAPDCSKENICADILLIDIHMPVAVHTLESRLI
jgi:DNA-binding response OmpR family regulator